MPDAYTYTLSLQDKITAKLQKIGVTSDNALDKFAKLQLQTKKVSQLFNDMGGSVGALRQKLALLKSERDWIPSKNLNEIRKYNTEIKRLNKQIIKLETINGSKFKRNLKDAIKSLPSIATNPITMVGAALFKTGKIAMAFDQGMAKINTTAQLSSGKLDALRSNLISMGKDVGADLSTVPDAFEKILSQTGDVDLSQKILKSSLKGSVAGFTDTTVVSNALAQSLSLIGKQNASAQEVLDTFFAAKRVGAGEFIDFANYIPSLIASGKTLGVTYKQTAGIFAYMTGKGFKAEKSAVLMENAYSALGKVNIQKALKKRGISIFDKNGSIRDMGAIFSELSTMMGKMSNEEKTDFLSKIGLKDKEARSAFMVLTSDSEKLQKALKATANAAGETDKAFELSQNSIRKIKQLWSQVQSLMISFGGVVSTIVMPVIAGLTLVLTPVVDILNWLFDGIAKGNPVVLILTGIVAGLTAVYYAQSIALKITTLWGQRMFIIQKLQALWTGILTVATNVWTGAQWLLNAALTANPIGIIIAVIGVLIGIIVLVVSKINGWGKAWKYTMQGAKWMFKAFVAGVKLAFIALINGIMIGIDKIKLAWYKFKNALGIGDKNKNNAAIAKINADTEARKKAIKDQAKKVAEAAKKSKESFEKASHSLSYGKAKEKTDKATSKATIKANGIAPPKPAGTTQGGAKPTKDGDQTTQANKAIATGGTKHNYITLNINKEMIGQLLIKGSDFKDSAEQMEQKLSDSMLRIFALATTAGN